jgi:CarD family transcriptional regulator
MAQKKKTPTKVAQVKTSATKSGPAKAAAASVKKSPVKAAVSSKSPRPAVAAAVKPAAKPQAAAAPAPSKSHKPAAKVNAKPATKEIKPVAAAPAAPAPVAAKPAAAKVAPKAVPPVAQAQPVAKPFVGKSTAAPAPVAAAARPAQHAPVRAMPVSVAKPAGQKISAPVGQQPMTPKAIAEKAAAARQQAILAAQKKPVNSRHGFKTNEFIVYPAHGVGRIVGIEEQEIAGMSLELFVITFDKEKLTLRVPTGKLASVGMRKLADDDMVRKAIETLKGRARVKRTMWSRRAQEYVAKINSGDLVSIAEVVRDLYRSEAQPEQSYSERQLYEDALDRMAREIAAVEKLDERGAVQRITEVLSKSARGRRVEAGEAVEADVKAA